MNLLSSCTVILDLKNSKLGILNKQLESWKRHIVSQLTGINPVTLASSFPGVRGYFRKFIENKHCLFVL